MLETTPTLKPHLYHHISDRQRLVAMKAEIDKQIDAATDAIKDALAREGEDVVEIGEYKVSLSVSERKSLDKTLLVDLGVSTDILAKATKTITCMRLDVREKK